MSKIIQHFLVNGIFNLQEINPFQENSLESEIKVKLKS